MDRKDEVQSPDEISHDPDALRKAARRMRADEKGEPEQGEAGVDAAEEGHNPDAIDDAARKMYLRNGADKEAGRAKQ